jgi:hypothetical protein
MLQHALSVSEEFGFNPSKPDFHLNNIHKFSYFLTGNAIPSTNQSVLTVYSEKYI